MKHLFRHTTSLLRTALLLGAVALFNISTIQAQPVSLTSDMPDAFEAKVPVIGDGKYYFIQFYEEITYSPYLFQSFLGEEGEGRRVHAMDYLPFAQNRQWTQEPGSASNKFKLKSKRGFYVKRIDSGTDEGFFISTSDASQATEFERIDRGSYRPNFCELRVSNGINMGRRNGNTYNSDWQDMVSVGNDNVHGKVRFAQLKSNAAHIIYYREEHADGYDNSQFRSQENTTRHYMTYSGTGNPTTPDDGNLWTSQVSSRKSIIPKDKSLWTLPTAAAYHLDGLWDLEESGTEGEFYIKKHDGTNNDYLIPVSNGGNYYSNLGAKDTENGKYSLETPTANRYSRIQNVSNGTVDEPLTASMFQNWNGYGANASSTGSASVDFNVGNNVSLGNQAMVAGTSWVDCKIYADLSDYESMTINGTSGMQLRVLMSRQVDNNGPLVEKNVTISDGKAVVDLTSLLGLNNTVKGQASVKMTHVDGSDGSERTGTGATGNIDNNVDVSYGEETSAICGYNIVGSEVSLGTKGWGINNIIYLQVDASALSGTGRITKATLKATASGSTDNRRAAVWGAGYNNSDWSPNLTWNTADRSITDLTPDNDSRVSVAANTSQTISLDITGAFTNDDDNIVTILVYELAAAGGWFSNPTVEVEYSEVSYAHLNAIKTGNSSPSGTISSITLTKQGQNTRYFHRAKGDGWQVLQWPQDNNQTNDYFYAGFYPVEVPASKKDEFFQVRLALYPPYGVEEERSGVNLKNGRTGSEDNLITNFAYLPGSTADNFVGGRFTATADYQRCFRFLHNVNDLQMQSGYDKLVIRFAAPVVGNWNISGIVNGNQSWEAIPEGSTFYVMDLRDVNGNVYTYIDDFTIFNWEGERGSISIAEVYFYKGSMIDINGCSAPSVEDDPVLWQLEQENDYQLFRLKNENNRYLTGACTTTDNQNDNNAKYSNLKLTEDFSIRWYLPKKEVLKEIDYKSKYVRHKESYLRTYDTYDKDKLKNQGLATNIDSDWKNSTNDEGVLDGFTQKTNHFEITHYLKKGDSKVIEFPTVLNKNNDHIFYQRFYNYDEVDTQMNLDNLKAHVNLDMQNDGEVQYFLYKNGMVTGQKLNWTGIEVGDLKRNEQRRFNFTNSDGKSFTVGVDVSRYSDLEYLTNGDLKEPSLTMRYLFYMKDAKEMATKLTACTYNSDKWLEEKVIHFGRTQVPYTKFKKVGYRGEFIGLRHLFSDYWVFDGNGTGDDNLVSAVTDNNSGKIEVVIDDPHHTGIRKGGYNPTLDLNSESYDDSNDNEANYQGFYFYDKLSPSPKTEYGNSRFVVFRYPADGIVHNCGPDNEVYVKVYLNNNGTRYQLAKFTLIFDANMATRPWTEIKNGTIYANGTNLVKGTVRDPRELRNRAGDPIAKITFDYPKPETNTYHFPSAGITRHDGREDWEIGGTIANSSPVPLTFDNTNYAFDGDNCNWGSYTIVTKKNSVFGNNKIVLPADDDTYGYGNEKIKADDGMQKAFLYIDASEQPGDICAIDFNGDFCAGDMLMCSGWITGSNKIQGDTRCPGSITLTVKGKDNNSDEIETIYRFCPGQIYELDNGYQEGTAQGAAGIDGSGNGATHVVWQQFFFEFSTKHKYDHYWLEVNNNCVSSNGGDFMLDNIEVYAVVPEVIPEINTPLCVTGKEGGGPDDKLQYEMRLLKLDIEYEKLKNSANANSGTTKIGFVFLEKETFLKKLWDKKHNKPGFDYASVDALAEAIEKGEYILPDNDPDLKEAFDAALLGKKEKWDSTNPSAKKGAGVMYFQWDTNYNNMTEYSFAQAVNKQGAVFRYEDEDFVKWLVFNGNYPELPWKTDTEYYIVPTNEELNEPFTHHLYGAFNLCSKCSRASVFKIEPPYRVLGLESSETTNDYIVCEGQIPTILLDLKGYTTDGKEVDLNDLNFDWWLGNATTLATLENYYEQKKRINNVEVKLHVALSALRTYYTEATSLDGIVPHTSEPGLTSEMIQYLQELVDAGELVLHQKSVSIPAEKASNEDPYFYLVACPIHDGYFDKALNPKENEYVAYFCDEPQGLRIKVGQKAPTLKCGFVPGENGFPAYNYPTDSDPVLSIRLAKAAQFETVKNTAAETGSINTSVHNLWLPIRNAETESAAKVIKKSQDDNIYLASTNDPIWDKNIYTAVSAGSLPVVGRIVQLNAINTKGGTNLNAQNTNNRLCIYFTKDFDVREGYNYTLSLPFQEDDDANACDGTILINLKIVPDYEVWTGAAGNTDWNNDENWRRADGNTEDHSGVNDDELYVGAAASTSPLSGYKTNKWNYRTSKDRVFRKGFAPLYCTHVLMKSDEWGNAPELYDAIDGISDGLLEKPFPNLRETSTPILKFDMQARQYDIWEETYGEDNPPQKGRSGDLLAEMYQVNSCDEIAFQPGTELLNAHLLNYNSAWVEYQLDNKRWYLLGSPLQGTISGEWYAPKSTAQQKTTYYDPVKFGAGYDRYNPAIYQRSWDKAKAVLYEIGSTYSTDDDSQTQNLGTGNEGEWKNNGTWGTEDGEAADEYLDRLGYKPMGGNKANVAIRGIWSNTYNDATVDYANGGFSVMVMNHLKGTANDKSNDISIVRLPKEEKVYDYYQFSQTGANEGGTVTNLSAIQSDPKKRALNRGRLKTDLLLPTSTNKTEKTDNIYYGGKRTYTRIPIKEGDLNPMLANLRNHQEAVSAGVSNLGYYLVENPFPCGLDMDMFFAENYKLQKKYWLLTSGGQQLVHRATTGWVSPDEEDSDHMFDLTDHVVAPGQGFFVEYDPAYEIIDGSVTRTPPTEIIFSVDMQAQSRYGKKGNGTTYPVVVRTEYNETTEEVTEITENVIVYNYVPDTGDGKEFPLKTRGEEADTSLPGLVITAEREDHRSSAMVMQHSGASNDFLPEEDTETFITSDLENVPTVYTLCGRLATTINSIRDFRSLSIGVESNSDAPCTLTFKGVEMLGDSIAFYDAVEQKLTPLESGMQVSVSGQTQNRYYLVRGLSKQEVAEETHLQIFTEGLTAKVIASTAEPIRVVHCFDTSGRLLYTANPDSAEHSFSLPRAGIYIIEAQTEHDRKTKKVMTK